MVGNESRFAELQAPFQRCASGQAEVLLDFVLHTTH